MDFSILIPTYNRPQKVKRAILSVLRQKKVRFELIVRDDSTNSKTSRMMAEFKDNRIRYVRNKKRLGSSWNIQKGFLSSKGKYIFILGDDDFILDKNTLSEILKILKKYKPGVARIGSISFETSPFMPYQIYTLGEKIKIIKPKKNLNILAESIDFGMGYISGLVFDNTILDKKLLKLDHRCFPGHICQTYHKCGYDLILKKGIVYIPQHFIAASLSLEMIPHYFSMQKMGRLFLEDWLIPIKELASKEGYEEFKSLYLRKQLVLLPNIKLFTNYKNYVNVIRRLKSVDATLVWEPSFIFYTIIGFLPNFLIRIIKKLAVKSQKPGISRFLAKHRYFEKLEDFNNDFL